MKIDRLLAIVTYLLNRDVVTGKFLSDKFEVSERTIQRDIESINQAGIPITAIRGSNGGYKILDTFKLTKQTSSKEDLESIIQALSSLETAIEDHNISNVLEKAKSITKRSVSPSVTVDFGVAKENNRDNGYLDILKQAISAQVKIEFLYTNAENSSNLKVVEPVSLKFKWYSWYLVAYDDEKKRYCIFKLVRMTNLKMTTTKIIKKHLDSVDIFEEIIKKDVRSFTEVVFKCPKNHLTAIKEYLPGVCFSELTESVYEGRFKVIESERMWFAFLLSFGDYIEVIEPEHIRQKIVTHSKKIIKKYIIPDT